MARYLLSENGPPDLPHTTIIISLQSPNGYSLKFTLNLKNCYPSPTNNSYKSTVIRPTPKCNLKSTRKKQIAGKNK